MDLADFRKKLDEMGNLVTGWDSYRAEPPTERTLNNVRAYLHLADNQNLLPDKVLPSCMGGVGVTYRTEKKKVYLEFYNNNTACALFVEYESDTDAGMNTQKYPISCAGYQQFLTDTQTFLYLERS